MSRSVEIAPGRIAHCSGALWLPEVRTVLVADAHLGYAWAQRRRGDLGPLTDGGVAQKLQSLTDEFQPARIVFLGDVVHAPKPSEAEKAVVERTLRSLNAELVFVRGNHDRAFARDFVSLGVAVLDRWRCTGVIALHGNDLARQRVRKSHLVIGHWHPAVRIYDSAGAGRKLPAFLATPLLTVLPPFSPFAGGVEYGRELPQEVARLAGECRPQVFAVTGASIARVG